jgi:hypothetical protein
VPGDLPVFLQLALAVCREQRSEFRLETIVIPDRPTQAMRDLVGKARLDWPGDLHLRLLPLPERWVLPRLGNPGRNHALQLISGVAHCRASHIVLHDADLFLGAPGLLDHHYRVCRDRGLACLGVSPPWDPWFAEHGLHLAATWELCAKVEWLRSFRPALHMAHSNRLMGEEHGFDTTFYPQSLTDQRLIGVSPSDDMIHFNYVISNYRHFVRHGCKDWFDTKFRLLFISLLVELFDREHLADYRLPSLADMAAWLGKPDAPVRFPEGDAAEKEYRDFRGLLGRALRGTWVSHRQLELAVGALAPFDRHFGTEGE